MSKNIRRSGRVSSTKNIIQTTVYAAEPRMDYDRPTLEVNEDGFEDYSAGEYAPGEAWNLEGPAFDVRFMESSELPETHHGRAAAVMKSNVSEHQHYGNNTLFVNMVPQQVMDQDVSELLDLEEPDLDGSVNIENNNDFNIRGS